MAYKYRNGSNYDKYPSVRAQAGYDDCVRGWEEICSRLKTALEGVNHQPVILAVECYNGVMDAEVKAEMEKRIPHTLLVDTSSLMLSPEKLNEKFAGDITDDEIFGYRTRMEVGSYFDEQLVEEAREFIGKLASGTVIVYGVGAAWVAPYYSLLMYADMARWEIQRRYRQNLTGNVGADNTGESPSLKYKRGFFVDWRICDRFKKQLMPVWDFVLDTNAPADPKMVSGESVRRTLASIVHRPFRVVPFFDPGPWGGQWMKEVCGLDTSVDNYAWCFDCVPEENSLLIDYSAGTVEIPSVNLVFAQPRELLGDPVHARFGDEFPIRFDFLDTMQGGNLSLQVHPLTEYIQDKFGMNYTQDESYYILDAADDAVVYLGLKDDVDPEQMISELKEAQLTGCFDAGKHVGIYPVKKHDHVLIPAGTVHCSGAGSMVLEISATPFIFTFKLWDWGRLGLDGRPRPINIGHGEKVIQWERTEKWVRENILDRTRKLAGGDGWSEEFTGLHEREFIETRRTWFSVKTMHNTGRGVNVLNLVEGEEAIVESPSGAFEPFVVHYAETFIVPAAVGDYTITPHGPSKGQRCAVIKAYVRF